MLDTLGDILKDIIRAAHGGSDIANNLVTRIDGWVKDAKTAEQPAKQPEAQPAEPSEETTTPSE